MKYLLACAICLFTANAYSQELFTYTEPASNMPVKSFAVRINNYLMQQNASGNNMYSVAPELMVGISKKLMVHGEFFFGNDARQFQYDGASVYVKYRFYTEDEVHKHFRMALTGKLASSNNVVTQPAIDFTGKNSGAELGFVATKLINKIAISAGGSYVNAFDNAANNKFAYVSQSRNAFNYNLSFGKLFLPVEYKNYKQTNLNGMFELLGQTNAGSGNTFLDMAPSLQFIFLSKIRMDVGYRFPVVRSLERRSDRGFLLRVEYNFFNAFK